MKREVFKHFMDSHDYAFDFTIEKNELSKTIIIKYRFFLEKMFSIKTIYYSFIASRQNRIKLIFNINQIIGYLSTSI